MKIPLAVRTKKDEIYDSLEYLATQIGIMRRLYPRAMKELFLARSIDISSPMSYQKKKYKKTELKSLVMAHLEIDFLKKQYATN